MKPMKALWFRSNKRASKGGLIASVFQKYVYNLDMTTPPAVVFCTTTGGAFFSVCFLNILQRIYLRWKSFYLENLIVRQRCRWTSKIRYGESPIFIPDSPFMCLNHHAGQQIVDLPNFSSRFTAVVNPISSTDLSNFPIAQAANRSPQAPVD